MKKIYSGLWIAGIILTSLAGVAAFVYLFIIIEFNVYLYILLPIIFPFYQLPAVALLWLWKKKRSSRQ